ncbi:NAD-binding protein [Roridomyces roridus]|uniref:NAD-binding protein n=1 Tax=Roridomyces roridus TaxID=1738132 RepID=A0AAD7B7R3_9AGAR|nr:NAD-binding protein [Roridomyces roridus]
MGNLIAKVAPNSDLSTDLLPPSSKFKPERDIPDLSGKIVLVTGGNAGIGYHTVKHLLLKNAKVYLAGRSREKGTAAVERLEQETGGKTAIFIQLDLADLASVRRAATEFLALESRLDVLFNNGGVMVTPTKELTVQNYDLQFGTNVIGHFFFTELLLPALMASHKTNQVPARIISTSSSAHKLALTGIDFVSLKGGSERDARLYGESKLGNILYSNHLAKAYPGVIVSCALHPGSVRTDLQKNLPGWMQVMLDLTLPPAPMGAYTQLWAGTTAPHGQIDGQYLIPWARLGRADPIAASKQLEEEIIAYLREQVRGF